MKVNLVFLSVLKNVLDWNNFRYIRLKLLFKPKMKLLVLISIIYTLTNPMLAQQNGVKIIEEKGSKRHLIYAKNSTNESRSVFLKVNAIGYRRTADRPVIKIIPPQSKVLMITLIPLKDAESNYTYIFTANDSQKNLDVNRNKVAKKISLPEIMKSEVVIFTTNDCGKCKSLIEQLRSKRIKHREVNIDKRDRFYIYTWQLLKEKGYKTNSILLPIASVKGEIIAPIGKVDDFINQIFN